MGAPPLWKVNRELRRVGDQLARGVARLYEPAVDRLHLRRFPSRVLQAEGSVQAGPKIAVFVLYQPSGIAGSTFLTCRHLISNGYSPLVISNAPLQGEDQGRLAEVAWRVVERPNHGYDFGAYRDGLLIVREAGLDPDVLVLMNDSTWFPLWSSDRTLAELDARNVPFSGLSYKHEPRVRRGLPHMESHFLRFSREALAAQPFAAFWSHYIPSSSRITTIESGEKTISAAMEAAGFRPHAALSREAFLTKLATSPSNVVHATLADADLLVDGDIDRSTKLLARHDRSEEWADAARTLVAELTDSFSNILSGPFVSAALLIMHLPFLKKSREARFRVARERFLSLVDAGEIDPPDPVVLGEMRTASTAGDS